MSTDHAISNPLIPFLWPQDTLPLTSESKTGKKSRKEKALEELDDRALSMRAPDNPDAFLVLYHRYYDAILNFLYRRSGNVDLAEDLTSETFLSALNDLKRGRQVLSFRPWLYRIALNAHRSHNRSSGRFASRVPLIGRSILHNCEIPANEKLIQDESARQVRAALAGLHEKYRLPLMLRFDEEMPYCEIAETLNIPESTTRTRVARGIKLLRARMQINNGGRPR